MAPMKVSVKWSKQKFKDVDLDPDAPTLEFKAMMFSLTQVEPERQKIMVKGTIVKDDENWSKYKLKEKMMLMMMGTPSGKEVQAPEVATVFVEDQEGGGAGEDYMPPGLENISNTCYMNATIQCLGASKELTSALVKYKPAPSAPSGALVGELANLYERISKDGTTQQPMAFWTQLRQAFPQFNEQVRPGAFAQQDADDCWSSVMTSISNSLAAGEGGGRGAEVVKSLFTGEMEETLQCEEDADEPPTVKKGEAFSKLQCKLNKDIAHITMGLKSSQEGQLEKQSEKLGRSALYKQTRKVAKLPYYLTVQMMRFEWNEHGGARNDDGSRQGDKAKIIRACNFNLSMDAFDLCSEELKANLKIVREAIKDAEDKRLGLGKYVKAGKTETAAEKQAKMLAAQKALEAVEAGESADAKPMETDEGGAAKAAEPEGDAPAADAEGSGAMDLELADGAEAEGEEEESLEAKNARVEELCKPADPEMPENKTGWYELVAILTHKGQNADGGHYVAWVQHKGDQWVCFDDQKVTECRGQDLPTKLDGGTANFHMAYLLLYKSTRGERAFTTGAMARSPRK